MSRLDDPLIQRLHAVPDEVRELKPTEHLFGFELHAVVTQQVRAMTMPARRATARAAAEHVRGGGNHSPSSSNACVSNSKVENVVYAPRNPAQCQATASNSKHLLATIVPSHQAGRTADIDNEGSQWKPGLDGRRATERREAEHWRRPKPPTPTNRYGTPPRDGAWRCSSKQASAATSAATCSWPAAPRSGGRAACLEPPRCLRGTRIRRSARSSASTGSSPSTARSRSSGR